MTRKCSPEDAFTSLEKIVRDLLVDSAIEASEIEQLDSWCAEYRHLCKDHPFSQIMPYVERIMEDGKISADEMENLHWLMEQLRTG